MFELNDLAKAKRNFISSICILLSSFAVSPSFAASEGPFQNPQQQTEVTEGDVQLLMSRLNLFVLQDDSLQEISRFAKDYGFEIWLEGHSVEILMHSFNPYVEAPQSLYRNARIAHLVMSGTEFHKEMIAGLIEKLNRASQNAFWKVDLATPTQLEFLRKSSSEPVDPVLDHYPAISIHCKGCQPVRREMLRFFLENRLLKQPQSTPRELILSLKWVLRKINENVDEFSPDEMFDLDNLFNHLNLEKMSSEELQEAFDLSSSIKFKVLKALEQMDKARIENGRYDTGFAKNLVLVTKIMNYRIMADEIITLHYKVDSHIQSLGKTFKFNLAKSFRKVENEARQALLNMRNPAPASCEYLFK